MGISLLGARIGASLLGVFGALALLLAAMGVYGVTAYVVGQRTVEIGVRTALGAPAGSVLRLLMSETLRIVSIGLVVGIGGGVGLGAVASSQLYGVGALDPVALGVASLVLIGVAVLGTWIPSRRALRNDPLLALRSD
jgi:putative ABC transport system permease protein